MAQSVLDDLAKQIENVVKDWGHAKAANGVSVTFDVTLDGDVITVQPKTWAAGGPVTPNTPYIVGEPGPEIFTPITGGIMVDDLPLRDDTPAINATMPTLKRKANSTI